MFFPCPTGDSYRNHRFGDLTFFRPSPGVPSDRILIRIAPLSTLRVNLTLKISVCKYENHVKKA